MPSKTKQGKLEKKNARQIDTIQAAIEYGVDISMLMDNIKRSPAERIKRHQIALNTADKLRKVRYL